MIYELKKALYDLQNNPKLNHRKKAFENILEKGGTAGQEHKNFAPFPTGFLTLSQTSPGFYESAVEVC